MPLHLKQPHGPPRRGPRTLLAAAARAPANRRAQLPHGFVTSRPIAAGGAPRGPMGVVGRPSSTCRPLTPPGARTARQPRSATAAGAPLSPGTTRLRNGRTGSGQREGSGRADHRPTSPCGGRRLPLKVTWGGGGVSVLPPPPPAPLPAETRELRVGEGRAGIGIYIVTGG